MPKIEDGTYVLIVHNDRRYLKRVKKGESYFGKGGRLSYDELIGKEFGFKYGEYAILEPTLEDVIMLGLRRETQIVYPKDSAYVCLKLNLKNGSKVLEIGAGSGGLTLVFSRACGKEGKVVSLEREERHYKNLKKNLESFGELANVDLILGDVDSIKGDEFDACFIDVREPWLYTEKIWEVLKPSGVVGTIVPTANQISETLKGLERGFANIEVLEILIRPYKTVPERIRPVDRMVAHTGYLIFARKVKEL